MINILNGFITIISNVCRIELYILRNNSRDSKNSGHPCTKKKTYVINIYKPKMTKNVFFFSSLVPSLHPFLCTSNTTTTAMHHCHPYFWHHQCLHCHITITNHCCQYCCLHHTTLSPRPSILSKFDIHIKIMGKLHFKS